MLKKIFLMIAIIFIFSASTKVNAADLYNGSPENLLSSLQKVATENKIKLWGFERDDYNINFHYGSNEFNSIKIFSTRNQTVFSVYLTSEPNNEDKWIFVREILMKAGANNEEIQKFMMEYIAYYSNLATKEWIKVSKLKKKFKINCKFSNKTIYIESDYGVHSGEIISEHISISQFK